MMYEFNKKQKIIVVIIGSMIIIAFLYYIYTKEEDNIIYTEENVTENIAEDLEESEENTKEEINKIIVHVSGAVNKEGIVELEENSRVNDAIEKAGGVTENAYMKDINLAYKLEDGMKIYIPSKEEVENTKNNGTSVKGGVSSSNKYYSYGENTNGSSNVNSKKDESNKKVNINTANKEELDTLPGIGEATVGKIIDYRNKNGKFKTKEEIKEVSGIGDSKYEQIKDLIEI